MTTLIMTALVLASLLLLALSHALTKSFRQHDDTSYRDKNGDHIYYERSLIEKKLFRKLHPDRPTRCFAHLLGF